jgi:hypothetical protein
MMVSIGGVFIALFFTGIIGVIAWWQWNSYATLDRRIESRDVTLLDSAGTRIEKVLDAPPGSVIVPFVPATVVPTQPIGQISNQEVGPIPQVGGATEGAQQNQ